MIKTCYYTLILLAILATGSNCKAQTTDSAQVIGALNKCWRQLSHVFSPIYGLDEKEVVQYAKRRLCFTRDSISLYYGVQYTPTYKVKRVEAETYARMNFDCGKQKLDINADSVYQIVISSYTKPDKEGKTFRMTDILAFDGYCLYAVADGVIFKLFDANAKVEGRSSN